MDIKQVSENIIVRNTRQAENLRIIAKALNIQFNMYNVDDVLHLLEIAGLSDIVIEDTFGNMVRLKTFSTEVGDAIFKKKTKAQRDSWKRIRKMIQKRLQERENLSKHYINSFHESIESIVPQLDISEAGVLFELILHMNLGSQGYLKISGDYLTLEDIIAVTGLGKTTLIKYLKKFKELGILNWERRKMSRVVQKSNLKKGIKKGDTEFFTANAYRVEKSFHWMGRFDDNQMTMNFTKTYKIKAKELTANLSLEAKGLLYMIMTKIHYQTYYLSLNPNIDLKMDAKQTLESNIKNGTMFEVEHLTRKGLLELINKSDKQIRRYIKELHENFIISFFGRGKNEKYMVNPELFARMDSQDHNFTYFDAIKYQFEQLRKQHKM
ncbi:hypothetical protein F4694_005668 [Bacillus niacini]|uniref:Uncharacterized protein n=1 Tax=Neobacillus niacini TaxID=86668 RepID=A0A852TJ74_9BACI|nr:hypothetical protein [Neobacillus niacini]NYE08812.1 hypothetical protein [Neobacillus niacini]